MDISQDTIFILNMQLRMVKDTMRLNPPPELFMEKCIGDLEFVDRILGHLTRKLAGNTAAAKEDTDSILDIEWQFSQILTIFFMDSCPFYVKNFPEIHEKINALRLTSNLRRKDLEKTDISLESVPLEPGLSFNEMSSLLEEF